MRGVKILALVVVGCANPCEWHEEPWSLPEATVVEGTCWGIRAFRDSGIEVDSVCPNDNIDQDCTVTKAGYLPANIRYYVKDGENPPPPQVLFDVPCSIQSCRELDLWALTHAAN